MTQANEVWTKFKGAIITGLSSLMVAGIGSGGYAAYQGLKQAFAELAPRSYVHQYVDTALEQRDAIARLEADIEDLQALIDKAENAEVIEGLQASLESKQAQLEALRG